MEQQLPNQSPFVVDLLTTLRNEHFSLAAWGRFFRRSWEMSRLTARTHPALARSWQRVAMLLSILALALFWSSFVLESPSTALRLLPGFFFCVAWQISDLYWHLGLIRPDRAGKLYTTVGLANFFTQLRGLAASFLLGRLIGGVPTTTGLALLLYMGGVLIDIIDGLVARHTRTTSILGQLTDGEADFCLYLAITLILIQQSVLPLWMGIIMLARFIIPLLAALASYFLFVRRVRFGSTLWGKLAGTAQCLYFFVLLAPVQLAMISRLLNLPLLILMLMLLIIAPVAQVLENVHLRSSSLSATMPTGGIAARKDFSDEDTTSI